MDTIVSERYFEGKQHPSGGQPVGGGGKLRVKAITFLLAAIIAVSSALGFSAEEKKKLLFIAPTFNIEGVGYNIDSIKQIGGNLLPVIEKKTGLAFKYEIVGSTKLDQNEAMNLALDRLKDAGDLSWMDYKHFREARKRGLPFQPVAVLTTGGKTTNRECLYVNTDKSFKKLDDLRNKNITGGYLLNWIGLRALLTENGINDNPDEFFKDLIPVKTYTASMKGALAGYIDTFFMLESVFGIFKASVSSSDKFVPLKCVESSYNMAFPIVRETVAPDAAARIKEIFLNVHNDPDMGVVSALMKQINVYFINATPEIMKKYEEEYQKAVKRGWFKESEDYTKSVRAMEKKDADIKKCRNNCEKKKEDEKKICIELCKQKKQ